MLALVAIAGAAEMSRSTRTTTESRAKGGQQAVGAGLTMAVSVGLFAYGGLWLDRQFGTRPWFLLLLSCCGIVGGMLHLIRVVAPDMWPFGKLASDERDTSGHSTPERASDSEVGRAPAERPTTERAATGGAPFDASSDATSGGAEVDDTPPSH